MLTTASLVFHVKWSAVWNLKMWFHCGYSASKSANLALAPAWSLHIRLMEKGGRDLLSQTKCGLCVLCGCRAQHTETTQDGFYSSAQGPWQQPQLRHTHKQRGNLTPCSWHLLTSHSSCRRSFSHGVQDLTLLAMEISVDMNTSILSGTGLEKLVGNASIIFGKILNSHQICDLNSNIQYNNLQATVKSRPLISAKLLFCSLL